LHQHDLLGVRVVHIEEFLMQCAQSTRVRHWLTVTCRQPRSGSQTRNRLYTPQRSYSIILARRLVRAAWQQRVTSASSWRLVSSRQPYGQRGS